MEDTAASGSVPPHGGPIEYRPVREAEAQQRAFVTGYAFAGDRGEKLDADLRRALSLEWARGLFDGDRLIACLLAIPYTICFEGRQAQAVGIGDVACLPERRRQGHVGRLLRETLAEMHEHGVPFSCLWTPHVPLYRRYGWEVASHWLELRFPVKQAALRGGSIPAGQVERVTADDWHRLDTLYSTVTTARNTGLLRWEAKWRFRMLQSEGGEPMDVAVWVDASGRDRGYAIYRETGWQYGTRGNLRVREVRALDGAAYRGLTAYLLTHDLSQDAIWWASEDEPVLTLLDDPGIVTQTRRPALLLRLVDLPAAFAARPCYASSPLSTIVEVRDRTCPWNEGRWRLSAEGGRISAERSAAEPDLGLDVSTLAALFNGSLSPFAAALAGLIDVYDAGALERARDLLAMRSVPEFPDEF